MQNSNTITDIASLIPQRDPIMMLDSFACIDERNCSSSLEIREGNIFVNERGVLAQEGILEHVAQSAAAWLGYKRLQEGKKVTLGFIGDIRKCSYVGAMPVVGDTVHTNIRIVSELGDIFMISATTSVNGQDVVVCSMKLASEE